MTTLLTSNIRGMNGNSAHSFNGTQRHPTILMAQTRDLVHSPSSSKVLSIKGYLTHWCFSRFKGTSIAFIGVTPPPSFPGSHFATVSIDRGTAYNTTYGTQALSVSSSQAYIQWYQSPTLSDGNHIITLSHFAGAIDMALITVGPNTSLQGKMLIADNDNPGIEYSGTWTRNSNPFNSGVLQDGFPIGNTTHRSTTLGDTISFRFTGESVRD